MDKPEEHGASGGQRAGADALRLQHPNIATGDDRGDSETLRQYLARVGRLPAFQGLALATELLSALAFAHRQGRVHGAIHPLRLRVSRSGQLKVDGFDEAGAAAAPGTPAGLSDGTPYRAPEQRLGQQPDHRADLYAAAVVAYEVLTGALPFMPGQAPSTGQQVRGAMPPPVRTLRPELPVALDAVFQRALAQRPDARYPKAADLLEAFHAAFDPPIWERPPQAAAVAGPVPMPVADPPQEAAWLPAAPPLLSPPAPALASRSASRGLGLALVAVVLAGSLFVADPPVPGPDTSGPATVVEMHAGPAQPEARVPAPHVAAMPRTYPMTSPAKLTLAPPLANVPAAPAQAARQSAEAAPEPDPAPASTVERARQVRPATTPERSAGTRSGPARATPRDAAPASKTKPPAAPAAKRAPAAPPSLGCGRGDSVIARQFCVAMQCAKTEFRRHPVCVRIHAEQRARDQLAEAWGAP